MAHAISKKDVEYVARLARLKLTEEEREEFTLQLNKVLDYMAKLEELDTTGIEPTAQVVPLSNVRREDETCPSPPVEEILKNAPDEERGYFKVPRIIE